MSNRTVTVESQQQRWLLDQIEQRLEAIGKNYYQNGQAYSLDLEIAGLRRLAVQFGSDFDIKGKRNSFEITRFIVEPTA